MTASVSLQSLLETHDYPFAIVDAALTIVAVNRAYENQFGVSRDSLIGAACCRLTSDEASHDCRHRQMFRELESYRSVHEGVAGSFQVRGYPLVDNDNVIYLGESILPLSQPSTAPNSKMAGESPAFREMQAKLQVAAKGNVPVLLQGETGTGKEVAAEYVHDQSPRKGKPLVVVDCTVLGEDLFESEVFGHEKGAFTGAAGTKKGLFEMADGGTLFLDEVGELPLSQQPKLLRALESGTFRRVGGSDIRRSDVRVIGATHRDLPAMVARGEFREDLYYRLAVFPVALPALRERRADIPSLADHLLGQIGKSNNRHFHLTRDALVKLLNHPYPGNVRELRNILQLATALASGEAIESEHIYFPLTRESVMAPQSSAVAATLPEARQLNRAPLESMEIGYIEELLRKHDGNRRLVALEMNISERTLYRKLKRFELNAPL
jgi:transcriptional regulator with PAS, ATPase and Fis domain